MATTESISMNNKIYYEANKELVKALILRHHFYFVNSFSQKYPFTEEMLHKYHRKLDWGKLSFNKNIQWSDKLVYDFRDKWVWYTLFRNPEIEWDISLIGKLYDKINEKGSVNELWYAAKIKWTKEVIDKYSTTKEFSTYWHSNPSIPFDFDFLDYCKDKISWWGLSRDPHLPLEKFLTSEFKDYLNFEAISYNTGINWSQELIQKYEDKWQWSTLSANESLPWSEQLIERFVAKWSWESLAKNKSIPWTQSMVQRYNSKLLPYKDKLFKNPQVKAWDYKTDPKTQKKVLYTAEDLRNNPDINWYKVSNEENMSWDFELIDEFLDKWDWGSQDWHDEFSYGISTLYSLPWGLEILSRYENKFDWGCIDYVIGATPVEGFHDDEFMELFLRKVEERKQPFRYPSRG